MRLAEKTLAISSALTAADIPFAFGGAIALAFCAEPRATGDIDVNVFLPSDTASSVLDVVGQLFTVADRERVSRLIERDAQARLRWDEHPVDLFFSDLEFHDSAAGRIQLVEFENDRIPVLSAEDLIICKIGFNRPKDWLDIRSIFAMQGDKIDVEYVRRWVTDLFGAEEPRLGRFLAYVEPGNRSA